MRDQCRKQNDRIKLPLNYLPFSHPGLVECMKEWFIHFYYITAMFQCLQSFVICSFGGNIA